MLSASRRQPHLLHVSAVDRRQIMNFSYLQNIHGGTHIVRFLFFLFLKYRKKTFVANALSSDELSIMQLCTDEKWRKK